MKLGRLATVKPYHGWQFVLPDRDAVILVGGLRATKATTIGLIGDKDDPDVAAVLGDYKNLMADKHIDKVSPDSIALIVLASLLVLVAAAGAVIVLL